jgi:hypothetical protein
MAAYAQISRAFAPPTPPVVAVVGNADAEADDHPPISASLTTSPT